jgi:hypothetical protein
VLARALMVQAVQVQVAKVRAVQVMALQAMDGMFPGGSQKGVEKLALLPLVGCCRACRYFLFLAFQRMVAMFRGL